MVDVGLTHVALPSSNLGASAEFYARYAAMSVVHEREGVLWLSDRSRPFVLVLVETGPVERPLVPIGHLGVGCANREEVDRLCGLARDEGRLLGGPNDHGPPVGYWAFIRDPDGHCLEISFGQEVGRTVERSR